MQLSRESRQIGVALRDTLIRQQTIDQVRTTWRAARHADARLALKQNPILDKRRSCVLELAYEEYCFRIEQGEDIQKSEFCRRFPSIHRSLARQIEVHNFLEDVPDLVPGPVAPFQLGTVVFDEFRLLEELGRGALARVYLCEQIGVGGRQVVLKIAHRGGYEADTMGRLKHPHIAPIYSVHEDPETRNTGICMPFQGRSTLCDVVDLAWQDGATPDSAAVIHLAAGQDQVGPSDPLPSESFAVGVARIGIELAGALHHAHENGIRHDDLKPSNVLITPAGQSLLMDFNLSTSEQARIALTGGTIPYMSPEQLQKNLLPTTIDSEDLDFRTDVFSLGVVLYELLTGTLPFGEPERHALHTEIVSSQLQQQTKGAIPIHELNPSVPPDIAEHVMSCLAFDRANRPDNLASWAEKLQNMSPQVVAAKPTWSTGRKLIWLAAVVVIALGTTWSQSEASNPLRHRFGIPLVLPVTDSAFELGRFYMDYEKWSQAAEQFNLHAEKEPDGATFACLAYCYGNLNHQLTDTYLRKAHETGFESAGFCNNFARMFQAPGHYDICEKYLDRALTLAPNAPVALYNRARLDYLRYSLDRRNYVPWQGASDLVELRRRYPNNGVVAQKAAMIFAIVAAHDADYVEPALEALRVARRRGFAVGFDPEDEALRAISRDPRFSKFLQIEPETHETDTFERLMNPIQDPS